MNANHLLAIVEFMKFLLPGIQEVISDVEGDEGFLNLPEKFSDLLTRDGLPPWSSYYEQPEKMRGFIAQSLFSSDELAQLEAEIKSSSPEEIQTLRLEIQKKILEGTGSTQVEEVLDSLQPDQAASMWANMEATEQTQAEIGLYFIFYTMLTQIHYYFALITYGKNICDLIEEAKAGVDDSFYKVVRIDRTVLFGIPYFQKRLIRAQLGREPEFLKKLSNAIKAKPLGSKYSHKMLMFVFAILDDEGLLYELSPDQLMDICEDLGVYGHDYGVEDPASLRKLLNKYKRNTRRQNQI
tara:strand:+ start:7227 stop:8114 length:888 start_codon:yes stop_codon:yes gene_type:complete